MDTFAFGMRRNRLFRALGPNPLVRRSDRIQALSLMPFGGGSTLGGARNGTWRSTESRRAVTGRILNDKSDGPAGIEGRPVSRVRPKKG